jgi:AmmeMemoRadiSam system protein A
MSSRAAPIDPPEAPVATAPPAAVGVPTFARRPFDAPALAALLDLARAAVVAAVRGYDLPDASAEPGWVVPADAFVTLRRRGRLRGCIGTLGAGWPVGRSVVHAGEMAALDDPRFPPVGAEELAELDVEVSILTPPRPLEEPGDFVPGRDGIVVEARGRRGLLLPQVATEMGWGAAEMIAGACEKAGLRPDAWLDPATRLEVFEVARADGPLIAR